MTQTSILIVDDSAPVRRMMRSLFADSVTVYECDEGAKAQQCYAAQQPDWVLMDLTLNGTDGLTVMRQILTQWPQARVMIVTNYDDELLREEARQAGACGYVLKEKLWEVRGMIVPSSAKSRRTDD